MSRRSTQAAYVLTVGLVAGLSSGLLAWALPTLAAVLLGGVLGATAGYLVRSVLDRRDAVRARREEAS